MRLLKLTEEQLAERVVGYLCDLQWEVYQEVQVRSGASVADIVAVQGALVWIVECKVSFGFKVCSQAFEWIPNAHFVSVAVPHRNFSQFEHEALRHFGIGVLTVGESLVREECEPALNRNAFVGDIRKRLTEQHKTYAKAGNSKGRRWTPFQATCDSLRYYVQRSPGCLLKDAIENTRHHYESDSTARSCMRQWLDAGVVKGVRLEREGRLLRLYAAG